MSTFEDRRKSLFEHLNAAERDVRLSTHNEFKRPMFEPERKVAKRIKSEMKHFRGKESIFKRPEATLSQCLRHRDKPAFRKNPNKWQYYNLEHITEDDMSDRTNTATGLAFMKELEERAKQTAAHDSGEMDTDVNDDYSGKPLFKQPSAQKITSLKSNKKIVVPLSIGSEGSAVSKNSESKIKTFKTSNINLRLDHLFEEEFED